jgi:thermitase
MPDRATTSRALSFAAALAVATLALCGSASASDRAATSAVHDADGRLLVKFDRDTSPATARALLHRVGARPLRTIPGIDVRVVSVPPAAAERARSALLDHAGVEFAERDAVATPQETVPDDPFFPHGAYALSGGAWGWYQTHTTQAWDVTKGDPSVVIAILDTGLKTQAKDFTNQLVAGWNVLTGSADTSSNAGTHGTHVAGVAGLASDNGLGNAGYCPRCKLMPVQVGTDTGAAYSDMATGITWATDHGARVINLSWAGTTASSTLTTAVSYARSRNAVVFAAAGNSNCDCPAYPAATSGVLGVAGVGNAGAKAGDSNFGSWVAVAAPQGNMTSWPAIGGAPGFAPVGGTSLASPAAAGIAGLALSAVPSLSGAQVEQALQSSATPASFTVRYGTVNAMAALRALGLSDPQGPGAPVNVVAPQILASVNSGYDTAPLTAAPAVGQLLVRGQGGWTGSTPLSLSSVRWQRCNADGSACTIVGSSSKYTVQAADSGFALKLVVTFTDPEGSTTASALSSPVGGSAPPPPPSGPVNTAPPAISGTPRAGMGLTASSGTWSGSPTAYAYQWSRCDSTGAGCASIAGATSSAYTAATTDVGATLRVAVTASNGDGSATASSAPTAVVQAAPLATVTQTFTGSLTAKAASKSFAISAGAGVASARLSFTKCSSLSLKLTQGATTIASASGPSILSLDRTVTTGGYTYVVSGTQRCSFTLTVTAAAP